MNLTWRELLAKMPDMGENEIKELLVQEHSSRRRTTVLLRLHQRFCMLRSERERRELLA